MYIYGSRKLKNLVINKLYFFYTDINECEGEVPVCHDDAFCMDTDGSYECMCKEGYSGNGTSCIGKLNNM